MIGEKIKRIRKSKKMTQSQLAAKLGVTVGMISQYENNVNPPKIATLERIAEALDVNVLELYDGERQPDDERKKMEKTVSELIEEVRNELCDEFCKYAEECDKEMEEKGEITRCCPLDKL